MLVFDIVNVVVMNKASSSCLLTLWFCGLFFSLALSLVTSLFQDRLHISIQRHKPDFSFITVRRSSRLPSMCSSKSGCIGHLKGSLWFAYPVSEKGDTRERQALSISLSNVRIRPIDLSDMAAGY